MVNSAVRPSLVQIAAKDWLAKLSNAIPDIILRVFFMIFPVNNFT
jgi:hypothetical protein